MTVRKGILITIDEVQKIGERDMESICAAVQMGMRKGMPLVLLMAGLPGAKQKVSSYEGCTFMQRAWEVEMNCLLVDETIEAFRAPLKDAEGIEVADEALWELAQYSQGFPYLIQLLGYYLVDRFGGGRSIPPLPIDVEMAASVEPSAALVYEENVLRPAIKPLGESALAYLKAAATLLNDEGSASTGEIAASLGKTLQQCSATRGRLIASRLIVEDGYGRIRFAMPYLAAYLQEGLKRQEIELGNTWSIR